VQDWRVRRGESHRRVKLARLLRLVFSVSLPSPSDINYQLPEMLSDAVASSKLPLSPATVAWRLTCVGGPARRRRVELAT